MTTPGGPGGRAGARDEPTSRSGRVAYVPASRLPGPVPSEPQRAGDQDLFGLLHGADPRAADDACGELVRRYEWLARSAARRYAGRGESDEDLRQVAYLGLVKAIRRFEADRGVDFPAFARPTVLGELRRHFRDQRRWIRIPRRLQELRLRAAVANEAMTHELGRRPTTSELAACLGIDVEEALEIDTVDTFVLASLHAPLDPSDPESGCLLDTLGGEDPRLEHAVAMAAVEPLLAQLHPRERRMLQLRFYGDRTQAEIGADIGVSQMHVSRMLEATLSRLRRKLAG